jgi:hypothetical protein
MVKKLMEAHEEEHANPVLPQCKQRMGQCDWLLSTSGWQLGLTATKQNTKHLFKPE